MATPCGPGSSFRRCSDLNRGDDALSLKLGSRWANSNWTRPPNLHGLLWHPMAYDQLPNCRRNLTKVPTYAQMLFDKTNSERWVPDASMAVDGGAASPAAD